MRPRFAGHQRRRAGHDRQIAAVGHVVGHDAVTVGDDVGRGVFIKGDGVARRVGGGRLAHRVDDRHPLPRRAGQPGGQLRLRLAVHAAANAEAHRAGVGRLVDVKIVAGVNGEVVGRIGQRRQEELVLSVLRASHHRRRAGQDGDRARPIGRVRRLHTVTVGHDEGRAVVVERDRIARRIDGDDRLRRRRRVHPLPGRAGQRGDDVPTDDVAHSRRLQRRRGGPHRFADGRGRLARQHFLGLRLQATTRRQSQQQHQAQ